MCFSLFCLFFFLFKQKTAYEMRISDWSSDVCSSDLAATPPGGGRGLRQRPDHLSPRPGRLRRGRKSQAAQVRSLPSKDALTPAVEDADGEDGQEHAHLDRKRVE